jgi:glycine/D-amino acid oxidase-like deaminating enzyme
MWTAYFLKERNPGIDVVLLEQDICGGGPSGRNGGFLGGWWGHLAYLVERFGDEGAMELALAAARSVGEIGAFCRREGVDAWYVDAGDIGVATAPTQVGLWERNVRAAAQLGLADVFQELSPDEVRKRVELPRVYGGVRVADAATVHPARLARGLRRVLLDRGVRIFEHTPVTRFRADPPEARTPAGTVRAREAVVALGPWGIHWKEIRSSVAVRGSYMVITEPAPELLEEISWTGGEAVRTLRTSLFYARTTPDGRIAFGSAGLQPGIASAIGPRFAYDAGFAQTVAGDLRRTFPAFREVPIEAAWGGPIDVAGTYLPFIGSLPSGNVHYALGFTGNGVGPCHLAAKILAALAAHAGDGFTRLPLVGVPPKRFPPRPLLLPGMLAVNRAVRRKDDLEDEGRRVDPATRFVARLPRLLGYNLGAR